MSFFSHSLMEIASTISSMPSSFCLSRLSHFTSIPSSSNFISLISHSWNKVITNGTVSMSTKASAGWSEGGAGLLERPTSDKSRFYPTPQTEDGGYIGRLMGKRVASTGESYRVLLVDDVCHSEELVSLVLPQVVTSITPDIARDLFHESRQNGTAVVVITAKERAIFYSERMMQFGLQSTIEPDSRS